MSLLIILSPNILEKSLKEEGRLLHLRCWSRLNVNVQTPHGPATGLLSVN
uniref:Uncharacterized protein n=1 Tax=Anguilla anguilla TaxID=7936 RepID=A0A0E9T9U4_ANGAN